jgi:6-pyruvoyltetrahydropterin/6-carboxytetrahydropterin synthase
MVVDFTHIKRAIHDRLDHHCINDVVKVNPTAENMARWICDLVPHCYKVQVQESEGNVATYEKV